MIWSAIKILLFIAAVAGLTIAADWLTRTDASVQIVLGGIEVNLSALQVAIALVALLIALWLVLKLLGLVNALFRFANGDETAISRYFDRRSRERGFEALSEGLTALAAGDGRLALAKATKAERYLRRPDLTNLIAAQAAEMTGDRRKAEEIYKRLLRDDRTRFVGVRGLLKQKLQDGDTDMALKLAEKAFVLNPAHPETGDVLLRLQAEKEDWAGARKTLEEKRRRGVLPRDVHRRRDAVLALQEARDVFRHGTTIEARERAIEANRLSPDLVPAAVMAAQAYITDGKTRYAERVLRKAWENQPHPDLAATYASIAPEETPQARLKRFKPLLKLRPDHPETRMLAAELHIAAEDFAAAREALGDLPETKPTARSLALLAAIERGMGAEDEVVRALLTKAVSAPRGPQWVCENCNTIHPRWEPVCHECGAFDTIAWIEPKENGRAMPEGTDLMPLLVSTPAQKAAEAEPEEASEVVEEASEAETPQPATAEDRPG